MAARTDSHRQVSNEMRTARVMASRRVMSRAEFLAQTPVSLRVSKLHQASLEIGNPQESNGKR